jgi:copper(I)-binding protein
MAGYMTITNGGTEADRLTAAKSPLAGDASLHKMEVNNGVMSMTPIEGGVDIPAGGTVVLGPGSFHIMFMSLQGAPKEGDHLPVTLTFEKAGSVDTFLHVMAVGASSIDGNAMGAMNHDAMGGMTAEPPKP